MTGLMIKTRQMASDLEVDSYFQLGGYTYRVLRIEEDDNYDLVILANHTSSVEEFNITLTIPKRASCYLA